MDNLPDDVKKEIVDRLVALQSEIWKADQCADFLQYSKDNFVNTVSKRPDFPKRIRGFEGAYRWKAAEVKEWALKR